jgi:hypothetical protein
VPVLFCFSRFRLGFQREVLIIQKMSLKRKAPEEESKLIAKKSKHSLPEFECVWTYQDTNEVLGEMMWRGSNYMFPGALLEPDNGVYLAGSSVVWLLAIVTGHASGHKKPVDADIYIEHDSAHTWEDVCCSLMPACERPECRINSPPHIIDYNPRKSRSNHVCEHRTKSRACDYLRFDSIESVHTTVHVCRDDVSHGGCKKYLTDLVSLAPDVSIQDAVVDFDFSHLAMYFDGKSIFATKQAAESISSMMTNYTIRIDPTIERATCSMDFNRIGRYSLKGYKIANAKEVKATRLEHYRIRMDMFDLSTALSYMIVNPDHTPCRQDETLLELTNQTYAENYYNHLWDPRNEGISASWYIAQFVVCKLIQDATTSISNTHMPNVICEEIFEYLLVTRFTKEGAPILSY